MFGWLANLLIKAPIAGSGCACCEAKKEQLRQMQKAILSGEENDDRQAEAACQTACCRCGEQDSPEFEMTVSTRYKL